MLSSVLILASCSHHPPRDKMVYVGRTFGSSHPVKNQDEIVTIPAEFLVKPDEAFRKSGLPMEKFGYSLYADRENYYITSGAGISAIWVTTEAIMQHSTVVCGSTGEVLEAKP